GRLDAPTDGQLIRAAFARGGSAPGMVAVLVVGARALQSVGEPAPGAQVRTAPATATIYQPAAAVARLTEGPGPGQVTVQMDRPFSDARVEQLSDALGTEAGASFPSFGTSLL